MNERWALQSAALGWADALPRQNIHGTSPVRRHMISMPLFISKENKICLPCNQPEPLLHSHLVITGEKACTLVDEQRYNSNFLWQKHRTIGRHVCQFSLHNQPRCFTCSYANWQMTTIFRQIMLTNQIEEDFILIFLSTEQLFLPVVFKVTLVGIYRIVSGQLIEMELCPLLKQLPRRKCLISFLVNRAFQTETRHQAQHFYFH